MEDVLSKLLVEPIRNVYALLWRFGVLDVDELQGLQKRGHYDRP